MAESASNGRKHRSPAFPFIGLERALERALEVYAKERKHPVPLTALAQHWRYRAKSSGVQQTISSLKQYGFLAESGSGKDRTLRLTKLALRIILDEVPESPERAQAIKEAALTPKLFREMFDLWGVDFPSVEHMRTFLRRDKGFNEDSLSAAIRNYHDTLEYSKLSKSDKLLPYEEPNGEGETMTGQPEEQDRVRRQVNPTGHGISREVFSLGDGVVTLEWPDTLDSEGLADVDDWLQLVLRKLKRLKAKSPEGEK